MPRGKKNGTTSKKQNGNGANLGFEQTLWAAADKMRGHMDAAEYKHVNIYKGRVYDPCCGSGGMFVQSEKFVEAHGGVKSDISGINPFEAVSTHSLEPTHLAFAVVLGCRHIALAQPAITTCGI